MDLDVLYWHWILFGIGLMLSEIFFASFFIIWFGAAAVIIGSLLFLIPTISLALQVFIWTILSTVLALAWFKYLKPLSIDKTKAGMSKEAIMGEIGQVLKAPSGEERGKLRFPAPVLGDDEWLIISQDPLIIGQRVRVIDVSGNALIVEKV